MKPIPTPQSLLTARRRFFEEGAAPADLVSETILRSWTRCSRLGLDAHGHPQVAVAGSRELREARERHEHLRRLCRAELEGLAASAGTTNSVVLLTSQEGLVLDTLGSADFATAAARVALQTGARWSEEATGTNAIGTALAERRAVEVRGAEHYFVPHRFLSCAAVPIIDPHGALAGVLDLSGHAAVHHLHALGMVRLAVDQIEHRFFEQSFPGCQVLRLHKDPALLGTPREGVLVFDDHRLVAANRYGLALLDLEWEHLGARRIAELFTTGLTAVHQHGSLRTPSGLLLRAHLDAETRHRSPAPVAPAPVESRREAPTEPLFDTATTQALTRAVRLVDAQVPLLIQGETGTGKEVFARTLHARSRRAGGPFVAINCAALPESLIEAELFGYQEGAFTGARRQGARGLLREAHGGVLFLDEIGDMPLGLQTRLLRVLQEREVTPLGGGRAEPVDFALVCATHRDLQQAVTQSGFRADLYYRIAQYTVSLPPLRSLADRILVISRLWEQLGADTRRVTLAPDTLALLSVHPWPGNFRQLVGSLRALLVLAEPGEVLGPDALPAALRGGASLPEPARPEVADASLQAIAAEAMREALRAHGGNVSAAARQLGVSRSTLYRRLQSQS